MNVRTEADAAGCISTTDHAILRPVADHGIIGDLATLALVAKDGAIDFMRWPNFDSPTIFAAVLDPERGGVFELAPDIPDARVVLQYLPDTNVLLTRWMGEHASAKPTDFMACKDGSADTPTTVARRLKVTRGDVCFTMRCAPGFDCARETVSAHVEGDAAVWRPVKAQGV